MSAHGFSLREGPIAYTGDLKPRGIWMAGRLGELLVRENLISLQQLQKAQEEQKKAGGRIG